MNAQETDFEKKQIIDSFVEGNRKEKIFQEARKLHLCFEINYSFWYIMSKKYECKNFWRELRNGYSISTK